MFYLFTSILINSASNIFWSAFTKIFLHFWNILIFLIISTCSCRLYVNTRKNKQREIITIRRSATCEDIFEPHEAYHAYDFCRAKLDALMKNKNTSKGSCIKL